MANKTNRNRAQRRADKKRRQQLAYIMLALLIPIVAGLIFLSMPKSPKRSEGPQFTKEGSLQFIDGTDGSLIKEIAVEVMQDDRERATGMMWRKSMEDDQGMLFIMERAEPQTFWMRNTYVPLDIIFVSPDKEILNIRANAQPQSLAPQSSIGNALYVVEVKGGFCARYGVEAGDRITFELLR